jgi:hypothetical protein
MYGVLYSTVIISAGSLLATTYSHGQLQQNFHNELSLPILRILIGSKEIDIDSSL